MEKIRSLNKEKFYCQSILSGNIKSIQNFEIQKETGGGVEEYLKQYAMSDEKVSINHGRIKEKTISFGQFML